MDAERSSSKILEDPPPTHPRSYHILKHRSLGQRVEPIWGVFFAPIPTLPPWYFITPKNNGLAINWGTPFGGYWQDKSRILDNVRAFCVRCGLRFALRYLSRRFSCFCRCAAFCLCGTSRKGKRGATRGKRPWVFSPRAFRADECGRMHSRSALPERWG